MTDWRDERIAELDAQGAAKDARIAELEAQVAEKDARIATLEQQVAMLVKRVGELEEKLRQNSRNSHQPPSSDSPAERKQRSHDKSSRKRGGQPGHGGSRRELLPENEVDEVVDLYPPECENCWAALPKVADPCASRYQQTELAPIKPHTKEWRRHQVTCPCCGYKTRAAHDEKVIEHVRADRWSFVHGIRWTAGGGRREPAPLVRHCGSVRQYGATGPLAGSRGLASAEPRPEPHARSRSNETYDALGWIGRA